LTNEDLIAVEAPKAPKGMACLCVLGNGGEQFGFAFFESRRAFERTLNELDPRRTRRAFGVTFGALDHMPFADADVWEDHALPVAGTEGYPLPADFRTDRIIRPDTRQLTFIEALFRAFAGTTETNWMRDAGSAK
jgi:hypothetical protein